MQRTCLITLFVLFGLAIATPNYANPAAADGDWLIYEDCYNPPSGYLKSPIYVQDSTCANYSSFSLTMEDDNSGVPLATAVSMRQAYGVPKRTYLGGKLTINGKAYLSADYHLRTKSEHVLFSTGAQSDAELQVFFEYTVGSTVETVAIAFLIKEIPQDATASQYTSSPYANLMSSITADNWQLNFQGLAARITNHQNYNVPLNMYSYPGTLSYLHCDPTEWFVFGQELYATKEVLDMIRAQTSQVTFPATGVANNYNARPYTGTGGGSGEQAVTKLCWVEASFSGNFKVLSGALVMLAFLIFNL